MASGNSLTEMDVKINNFVTIDLLIGVRIEELIFVCISPRNFRG